MTDKYLNSGVFYMFSIYFTETHKLHEKQRTISLDSDGQNKSACPTKLPN